MELLIIKNIFLIVFIIDKKSHYFRLTIIIATLLPITTINSKDIDRKVEL